MEVKMAVYSGGANKGWVKERFLRQARYMPQLSVNAESANVITVDIAMTTFQEALNDHVVADEVVALECVLFDDNGIEALAAAFHLGEAGAGTEVSTTDQARLFVQTSAAGVAQLEVTDVVGASGATVHLVVRPLNQPGFPGYAAVTFD